MRKVTVDARCSGILRNRIDAQKRRQENKLLRRVLGAIRAEGLGVAT